MTPTPLENHQDIKELRDKQERVSIELGGMKNLTEGVRNAMDGLIIELKGLRKDMRENYVSRREFENTEKELDEMRDREMKTKDKLVWVTASTIIAAIISLLINKF